MNEGRTTLIFIGVAAVAFGLAWFTRPDVVLSEKDASLERVGEELFPAFTDPAKASSLQIVKYDETLAQLDRFEVARDASSGLWALPSSGGYPADATEQLQEATSPMIGIKVDNVATESASEHELYGVVNPADENLAVGASGVGMLVEFKDKADEVLASLIIGKEVKDREGLRYARVPTEDVVYIVEIGVEAFSSEFGDWIEKKLLGIRGLDINKVSVRDYTIDTRGLSPMLELKFDAEVRNSQNNWELTKLVSYEGNQPVEGKVLPDEELDTEFLNNLKLAVQDLEIIDVRRKPDGLAANLKASDLLLNDKESLASLQSQGFYLTTMRGTTEMFSASGDITIGTMDGVDYELRFGNAFALLKGEDAIQRYLLVRATVDESQFPLPEQAPLPETVEEMLRLERGEPMRPELALPMQPTDLPELDPKDAGSVPAEEPKSETPKSAGDENATEERPPSPKKDPAKESENTEAGSGNETKEAAEASAKETEAEGSSAESSNESTEETTKQEESSGEPESPDDCGVDPQEGDSSEETAQEGAAESTEPASEPQEAESSEPTAEVASEPSAQEGEAKPAADQSQEEPKETEEELLERLEVMREEIAKQNQRLMDARNERIDDARKKASELNARFSEWYYIVSDSVYEKLKITRDVLFKKKEALQPAAPAGVPGGLKFDPSQFMPKP